MANMLKLIVLTGLVAIMLSGCSVLHKDPKINSPEQLNNAIVQGWNTWDNRSIMTHVLLPEGLALQLRLYDQNGDSLIYAFTGNRVPGSEHVWPVAHEPDGSYTDFKMTWRDISIRVQSAVKDNQLYLLTSPENGESQPGELDLVPEILYDRPGDLLKTEKLITAVLPNQTIRVFPVTGTVFRQPLNSQLAYTTDMNASLQDIEQLISARQKAYQHKVDSFGDMAKTYNAVHNAMNWLVVYDPDKNRAVTPVSRPWSYGWGQGKPGGFILFCWDNFFGAFMHAIDSKQLAYNEALQMCYEIDDLGFVPNYSGPNNLKSRDRSQPPVGSMMVKAIYQKYPEQWFLDATFDRLLTWNRWWQKHRDWNGYLCWGSEPFGPILNDRRELTQNEFSAASNESGLDNTPMYDGIPFDTTHHLLPIADVGLMGLYIGDCEALADLAEILGHSEETKELRERAETYRSKLRTMWNEERGIFLNVRLDTGEMSQSISPTNFYALIGRAATQEQAERMINEHFYNPDEFWGEWIMPSIARNDPGYTGQDYWRGSIWAPMNFLVYLGLCNYDLPQARKDLADKSRDLIMQEWQQNGWIRENYHAETGRAPEKSSDHFYHWGALLGMINLLENTNQL